MDGKPHLFEDGYPVRYLQKGRRSGAVYVGDCWTDFPVKFRWHTGLWFELFEKHVEFIVQDIERARAEGRLILYLSCPISGRGGSYHQTNVEIADHAADNLKRRFGRRLWVLKPTHYQMESEAGTGLIKRHARMLSLEKQLEREIDVAELAKNHPITGGDYLRMWTRVLVEDGKQNLGERFDAFYFLGPNDVWSFFTQGNEQIIPGIERYFASKFSMDPAFRAYFEGDDAAHASWKEKRDAFVKFYSLKASAAYSLGSRDEFAIWRALNDIRLRELGPGSHIPGYFDGRQLEPGACGVTSSPGYAIGTRE